MKPVEETTVCVVDHGLYLPLAIELAKSFKRVLYQNAASVDGFPTLNKCIVGYGFDNLELIRVPEEDHWDYLDDIELYVFPDIYHGGEQLALESMGKAVWGSRHGDRLEIYRGRFLAALAKAGLEVPDYTVIHGLGDLREFLQDKQDYYVKISQFRGTMETFHWRDWAHDEGCLDFRAVKDGAAKNLVTYYCFPAINTDIEVGCDTYCIDGAYPDSMLVGYEWKDKAYFGAVTPATQIPEQLQAVNEAFASELSKHRYRNLISSEVRILADKFYFNDATRRFPCPGGGSQIKLCGNLAEIILHGANGELVQPEMNGKFACECVLTAKADKTCWTVVDFPEELHEWVTCGGSCQIDGRICWPPDESHGEEIGWIVNLADTPRDCIQGMLEKVKLLPDGVSAATESLADLLKEIESGKEEGIEFTNKPLPEPAEVIET